MKSRTSNCRPDIIIKLLIMKVNGKDVPKPQDISWLELGLEKKKEQKRGYYVPGDI
eukprot:c26026_g1_i1 orf=328-495(+)